MFRAVDGSSGWHRWREETQHEAVRTPEPAPVPGVPPSRGVEGEARAAGADRRARRAWNPAEGAPVDPLQRPPAPAGLQPDGTVSWKLRAPSEGPFRTDPGGAGGEPDGRTLSIRKVVWD